MEPSSSKKCRGGMGLRPIHYPYLETRPQTKIDWFEAISENYMDTEGRPRRMLELIREDYPVALHGVSMSLASSDGLHPEYLKRLRNLVDQVEPFIVSDHLCWTGKHQKNIHDLLPFPFTDESFKVVLENLERAQEVLGCQLFVENVSTYMTFETSNKTEWDFLSDLVKAAGTKILLDVNNIWVSSANQGFDPYKFIDGIPSELVGQIHLAGYTDLGDILFDTHSKPVYPEVWELFSYVIQNLPNVPFMVEWDDDIPEFSRVEDEVQIARQVWRKHHQETPSTEVFTDVRI